MRTKISFYSLSLESGQTGSKWCEWLPMNVQKQSPCIVIVSSRVEFAETHGLVHTIGGAEANNTGFSSENKLKMSKGHFSETLVPRTVMTFFLMRHSFFSFLATVLKWPQELLHLVCRTTANSEVKAEIFFNLPSGWSVYWTVYRAPTYGQSTFFLFLSSDLKFLFDHPQTLSPIPTLHPACHHHPPLTTPTVHSLSECICMGF